MSLLDVQPRHLVHGFIDALFAAKREKRAYSQDEAKLIAMSLAVAERNQARGGQRP